MDCVILCPTDTCSKGRTFQCFDGTCISPDRRCDAIVDCPGSHSEDEDPGMCAALTGDMRRTLGVNMVKCKNSQRYPQTWRCLYDTDRVHIILGCRDAAHLENCGKHIDLHHLHDNMILPIIIDYSMQRGPSYQYQ